MLDFWKKSKNKNQFKNKEEINKEISLSNKSINKAGTKLFDELKQIRSIVTDIFKKYGDLFDKNQDFKNVKNRILYVSKYIKYAYSGLKTAIENKNIKDEDSINSVASNIVKVRNMLGGEDYENSDLSKDEAKKALTLLSKVEKGKRNDEWYIYYNFLAPKLGKDKQGKYGKAIEMKVKKGQNTPTKMHKTKPIENTNKKFRTVAQNNERDKRKKQKEMDDFGKKVGSNLEAESEEVPVKKKGNKKSFSANTTQWF